METPRFQISLGGIFIATLVTSFTLGYAANYQNGSIFVVAGAAVAFLFGALTRFPALGVVVALALQVVLLMLDGPDSLDPSVAALILVIQSPLLIGAALLGWAFHDPIQRMGKNRESY